MYVCWQEGMEVRGQYTVKGQMMLAKKQPLSTNLPAEYFCL